VMKFCAALRGSGWKGRLAAWLDEQQVVKGQGWRREEQSAGLAPAAAAGAGGGSSGLAGSLKGGRVAAWAPEPLEVSRGLGNVLQCVQERLRLTCWH
jgi:hypothetical protein